MKTRKYIYAVLADAEEIQIFKRNSPPHEIWLQSFFVGRCFDVYSSVSPSKLKRVDLIAAENIFQNDSIMESIYHNPRSSSFFRILVWLDKSSTSAIELPENLRNSRKVDQFINEMASINDIDVTKALLAWSRGVRGNLGLVERLIKSNYFVGRSMMKISNFMAIDLIGRQINYPNEGKIIFMKNS